MNKPKRTGTVTVGQAVKLSGKSRSVIFRAIKNGQISATKNDKGHHLIDRSELTRWIDANRPEQTTEQTDGLTKRTVEQPRGRNESLKINAVDAIVKAKDETIGQQAECIAELKELLEREQGRGDRLEARLLTDQRPWYKRLLSSS